MNFLKKLISRQEHELTEEEKVRLDTILDGGSKRDKSTRGEHKVSETNLEELAKSLNLGQINRLRELIDEREAQLYNVYGLENNSKKVFEDNLKFEKPTQKKQSKIINVEEDITEDDLNDKTLEVKKIKEKIIIEEEVENEEEFIEYKEVKPKTKKEKKNDTFEILKDIFGAENIFLKQGVSSKHDVYKNRDICMIGIRKFDAYEKNETAQDQNAWFISHIKKFEKLKDFKMINSKLEEKELFCDTYEKPVSINYKAVQLLKIKDEFNFE